MQPFYHVACMTDSWKSVVADQVRVFKDAGLPSVKASVLGSADDATWIRALGLDVIYQSSCFTGYELPTQEALYDWAILHPGDAVMYVHTKGVSQEYCAARRAVRKMGMDNVVRNWRDVVEALRDNDAVGACWQDGGEHPHFSGGFWAAQCDYIARLSKPADYKASRSGQWICHVPWDRMHAEFWVGSDMNTRVHSTIARNVLTWKGDDVFKYNTLIGNTLLDVYSGAGHRTDKGTTHTYLEFYEEHLSKRRSDPVILVEIGGRMEGALVMWDAYFTHPDAELLGIISDEFPGTSGRVTTMRGSLTGDHVQGPVDIVIDDGSHQYEDQKRVVELYWPKLRRDGLLVIEDVQDDASHDALKAEFPFLQTYDVRHLKRRYDDRLLYGVKSA